MNQAAIAVIAASLITAGRHICAETVKTDFDGNRDTRLSAEIIKNAAAAADSKTNPYPDADKSGRSQPAEWTIMVYMNGKNNLDEDALADINEMELIGQTERIKIAVEIGRIASQPVPEPSAAENSLSGRRARITDPPARRYPGEDWAGVRRYKIKRDPDMKKISSEFINLGNRDMGNYKHLIEFANWAKSEYPAQKYMLIVWNHGDGWRFDRPETTSRSISFDDETRNAITIPQLAAALRSIGGVDVYASDACLMQMAEVAYEIRSFAKVIVGSQETEPGTGYPYNILLKNFNLHSNLTPKAAGYYTALAYRDAYKDQTRDRVTQSAVWGGAVMTEFRGKFDEWLECAMKTGKREIFKNAWINSQSFRDPEYKDLMHFVSYAGSESSAPNDLKAKTKELADLFYGKVLILNGTPQNHYKNAYGLSIYAPAIKSGYDYFRNFYKSMLWSKDGKWDEFIDWYLNK